MSRRFRPNRLAARLARLLALLALLLQCLSPVLAQSMPLPGQSFDTASMRSHPPHCPHHRAGLRQGEHPVVSDHSTRPCCGTAHCVCAVSVAAVNQLQHLPLQAADHPLSPEQSPPILAAFGERRLRPPDPLRNA